MTIRVLFSDPHTLVRLFSSAGHPKELVTDRIDDEGIVVERISVEIDTGKIEINKECSF